MTVLTKYQSEVLSQMPQGWFVPEELPHWVHAKKFICKKLKVIGYLESKDVLNDAVSIITTMYHRVEDRKNKL